MGLESVAKSTTQIVQASSMPEFQVTENWTLWHERFEMHLLEIGCESDTVKISTLLKSIGSEAYGVVHSLCSPTVPAKKSYDDLIALLKQQYTPPKIVFQERKNFYAAKMAQGETVASWFARVKKLAIDCSFDANLDNFVVDKFVCELPPRIFEKLCEEDGKLSSSDALKKAMLRETKLNQQNGVTAWSNEVDYVKPRGGGNKQKAPKNNNNNNSNGTKANNGKSLTTEKLVFNSLFDRSILRPCTEPFTGYGGDQLNILDSYDEIISQIKSDFSEIFKSGLGKCNTTVIKLPLINDSTPIFCKARPIPMAFREKIEQQLQQLVEQDIITPVNDSDWGTPIVPIPKSDGEIRICGDYKSTINRFLKDFRYPLPRIEEIFASMQGGQLFWMMMRKIVTGNNFAGHLSTLRKVLTKLQEAGLRLNVGKCKFFQSKISYLGFDVDKNGLSKNQERTKSVIDSPQPTNVSELRAFIGMVNHHSKFIPNFAQRMIPLYDLLKKDVDYVWTRACQEAFESMKKEICSDTILAHFDANKPIILTTDACGTAVAGRLSHIFEDGSDRPVAFVSRALNNAEKNYSTFEKEALAIIFSVTKLRQYLLGNKFILRTDHKPLVTIFGENKGIPVMAAARIQRWALLLSGFNYSIEYVKGALNTSDSLSRLRQFETTTIHEEASYINYVGFVNITQIDYKTIALHTRRDPILSKIMDSVQNGTLNNLQGDDFKAYRSKALELSVESGCVLWGYRTVIPSKLQKAVLEALHMSHLGIVKTKSLARSYVYWPNIDKDIEFMIKSCEPCQLTQPNPEKSSLIPWTPTDSAWKRIHIDFAGPIKGFMLFIVIDSFSKWVEVFKTKDITSAFVIAKLRETFCRYGLVDIIVSDNGRQFTSAEFQEFVKQNGINHIFTAPGNPSTNGQAENFVKTLKKSIVANINKHKNIDMDEVLNKFLFDYRITKHCTTNQSPSKIMFGREAKSRFSLMKPPLIRETIIQKNQTAIKNYKGKRNVEFSKGQQVYVRNYKNPNKPGWSPAIVKHKIGPRNYTCLLIRENRDIKRHLNQIRGAVNDDGASETSATLEQNDEVEPTDIVDDEQTGASSEDEETSENEHEASGGGEESFDTANSSNDSVTMADNTLIDGFPMPIPEPQVRQPQRACSKKAAEQITKQLQPNRNR
ncbi:uncharacterized protein K02A2.6-like [Sitodiplosis mosellana]|uniref:uncharacterized protein K02A2.6-like n=1 Tax=Sitodiplosis mosellana TaxID=263140 RepID=UPI002444223E|nr:uncharacterized protein K02A2.6-like [Sitodiplosis mosellana]